MNNKVKCINRNNEPNLFIELLFLYFCSFLIFAVVNQFFGHSRDYEGYQMIFTYEIKKQRKATEPFFSFLRFINDCLFSSNLRFIFLFTTIFSLYYKWKCFKNITGKRPYFIFFCFYSCFFWIHEYTQIRASCAIAIFFMSLIDLINNKNKDYLIKAFIATLFHYSAFTMFIFYLYVRLFKSKRIYILLTLFGFLFSILCSNFLGRELRKILFIIEKASGINKSGTISDFMSPFNKKYLILLITFILNALVTDEFDVINMTLMKAMSFGLCFYYWLNPLGLPVISVRLAEFYTSVFVLYYFLNIRNIRVKEKKVFTIIPLIVVGIYTIASLRTAIL